MSAVRVHPSKAQLQKFFEQVTVSPTGCWLWTGPVTDKGLPKFVNCPVGQATGSTRSARLSPKVPMAHRTAWAWFRGRLYAYPFCKVEQTCDVARCVNPAHLRQRRVPAKQDLPISTARLTAVFTHVHVTPKGCWHWTGATNPGGYAVLQFDDHTLRAVDGVLFAWFVGYGDRPPRDFHLFHRCLSRSCVNPSHLSLVPAGDRWTHEHVARGMTPPAPPKGQ